MILGQGSDPAPQVPLTIKDNEDIQAKPRDRKNQFSEDKPQAAISNFLWSAEFYGKARIPSEQVSVIRTAHFTVCIFLATVSEFGISPLRTYSKMVKTWLYHILSSDL